MLIAIGIPTLNEADNIEHLVKTIDNAASEYKVSIVIVNSDNNSNDGTSRIFSQTTTNCDKVALVTKKIGKGHNVKEIFKWVANHPKIDACFLIDGDVTSFQPSWLHKYYKSVCAGTDYIIPRYRRNYQEGNTTNHFVYPLLGARLGKSVPRQPISGDFGISTRLINHLLGLEWTESTLGYGIDIFMTLNALFGDFLINEIALDSKVHKPSFDKMIGMFEEVASSYYETIHSLGGFPARSKLVLASSSEDLMKGHGIKDEVIDTRVKMALEILKNEKGLVPEFRPIKLDMVDIETWSSVLIAHENMIGSVDSSTLSRSLLPWFLLRSTFYLKNINDANSASKEIDSQSKKIGAKFISSVELTL